MSFGFLHIGKTGGNSIRDHVGRIAREHDVPFRHFGHETTLRQALAEDPGMRIAFTFRDPAERFVSAFWSRLRMGRPRNNSLWSPEEAIAFQWFDTPTNLAEASSADDERLKSAALFAMNAISHLRRNMSWALGTPAQVEAVRQRIFFACPLDELDERMPELLAAMDLPRNALPARPAHIHERQEGRSSAEELSPAALDALRDFWADDFTLYDYLTAQFAGASGDNFRAEQSTRREQALSAYRERRHSDAASDLQWLSARMPGDMAVLLIHARNLGLLDRNAEAEAAWRTVAAVDPQAVEPAVSLGRLRYADRDYADALQWFLRALKVDGSDENVRHLALRAGVLAADWNAVGNLLDVESTTPAELGASQHWYSAAQYFTARDDDVSAASVCRARIRDEPGDTEARLELAAVLTQLEKLDELEALGLDESSLPSGIALLGLVRAALRRHDNEDARRRLKLLDDLSPGNPALQTEWSRLEALEREAAAGATTATARIIALLGISFCGSTMLGSILGSLPGILHVGESHRLTKSSRTGADGMRDQSFDFETGDPDEASPCLICGPQCTLFDNTFRASLATDPANWFQQLARQAGAAVLVSGDKHMAPVLDPRERYDAVILFKRPEAAYRSMRKRAARFPQDPHFDVDGAEMGRIYARNYRRFLYGSNPQGRTLCLNWESFTSSPEWHLARLCERLELPYSADALTIQNTGQHVFGGNDDVRQQLEQAPDQTRLRGENPVDVEDPEMERVSKHPAARAVFDELMAHHVEAFGNPPDLKENSR